jgi:hypothetical protein
MASNRFLGTIGNFDKDTPILEMHMALEIPYVCYYISKLYGKQPEIIQNQSKSNVRAIGQRSCAQEAYE